MSGSAGATAPASERTHGWLSRERDRVDVALGELTKCRVGAEAATLRDPMLYALSTSGKRIRPILCVTAYRAASGGEASDAAYRLGCAIEIVHTYSLVHDDLPSMDDDDLRRGRATVHRVFGTKAATLAAAALLPMAVETIVAQGGALGLSEATIGRLVSELCRAAGAGGMVGGQLMDLQGEQRAVDGATLEAIHRAKTGALLTAALRIGAIAGGAGDELLAAVTGYGEALGLAFQIVDDVLDETGDAISLGKTAGRDRELSKASYPALYGVDGARALARARADEAKAAVHRCGIRELADLADYVVDRGR